MSSNTTTNNNEPLTRKLRCLDEDFFNLMSIYADGEVESASKHDQMITEKNVEVTYREFLDFLKSDPDHFTLYRDQHIKFLLRGIRNLPSTFECLDSSRPWLCYWIMHSLYLLDAQLSDDVVDHISAFLASCQSEKGGFGGGPGQIGHLATTYAAVNTLCTLNSDRALKVINIKQLVEWMKKLKTPEGAFRMHEDGEEDLRGTYCAITVAKLCNLESIEPNLFDDTAAQWIVKCQTYEGGFGATPGNEAHGGYGFCGLASLKLMGKESLCDIKLLTRWLVNKQMKFEGGFQGRTNKLVDCCYSFWQAGMFPIIQSILTKDSEYFESENNWLFDPYSLQEYILLCCQCINGGVIDKPGKNRDYYHTCYGLSGLSISQHFCDRVINICSSNDCLLNKTHPLFNIGHDGAYRAHDYFLKFHSKSESSSSLNQID